MLIKFKFFIYSSLDFGQIVAVLKGKQLLLILTSETLNQQWNIFDSCIKSCSRIKFILLLAFKTLEKVDYEKSGIADRNILCSLYFLVALFVV